MTEEAIKRYRPTRYIDRGRNPHGYPIWDDVKGVGIWAFEACDMLNRQNDQALEKEKAAIAACIDPDRDGS